MVVGTACFVCGWLMTTLLHIYELPIGLLGFPDKNEPERSDNGFLTKRNNVTLIKRNSINEYVVNMAVGNHNAVDKNDNNVNTSAVHVAGPAMPELTLQGTF